MEAASLTLTHPPATQSDQQEVAFVVDQFNVADCPEGIEILAPETEPYDPVKERVGKIVQFLVPLQVPVQPSEKRGAVEQTYGSLEQSGTQTGALTVTVAEQGVPSVPALL